jgi:spermidine synthase
MALPVYLLFFLSGAASLIYQVAWVRSLSLVFGGSHLAVTTVLSVFMGGLALGSALFGRRADRSRHALRLYGALELGVAACALVFLGLTRIYPSVYPPLARITEGSHAWLTFARVALAAIAMLPPTTLMGGTLPVLTRYMASRPGRLGGHLSALYAVNTLGAVAGTLGCAFLLLKTVGVTATILVAVSVNVAVGVAALALPERIFGGGAPPAIEAAPTVPTRKPGRDSPLASVDPAALTLVLWMTGVSGFCALGYEVLWTRMLTQVVGTSVYSFGVILSAFLAGIALGSLAFGLLQRRRAIGAGPALVGLGAVEAGVGLSALAVAALMRHLPAHAMALQNALLGSAGSEFGVRQGASFLLAVTYVLVPAFLMGAAFPMTGTLLAAGRRAAGVGIGETASWNTVGAILGASSTGFVLVPAFGIERSLQMLAVLNVAVGSLVMASRARPRVRWAIGGAAAALLVALAGWPGWGRAWDPRFMAIFQNSNRALFDTEEKRRDALERFSILYAFEGVNETISVIAKEGHQSFVVNGRPEASTLPEDRQVQYALGHLPLLLHPQPRSVFVLGTGSGMTLGATTVHPEVERIVLAEIEPGVLPATRTFARYNHDALDSPRLRIVFNDGRNFLATTDEKFDVVTADPIHPWSGGAAYLYTDEYFASVAAHLRPGGIACQWLPLYELAPRDVKTVVRTFTRHFPYVMAWVTYWDTVLVGSNAPIVLDEAALARRVSRPEIAGDLEAVGMAGPEGLLSYFMFATDRAAAFAGNAVVNTDDNLFLEFSAPESMGIATLLPANVAELANFRESVLPYLRPAEGAARAEQVARWRRNAIAGRTFDEAHVRHLRAEQDHPGYLLAMSFLRNETPTYAPYRFLQRLDDEDVPTPRTVARAAYEALREGGGRETITLEAVVTRVGARRAVVEIVHGGQQTSLVRFRVEGHPDEVDARSSRLAHDLLAVADRTFARLRAEAPRTEPLPKASAAIRELTMALDERARGPSATGR